MTPPQAFGRYRVTSTLGAGAMGEVYLAVDDVLGREVAIKTLRANAANGSAIGARILDERFRAEARAIAQLTHPAIVQVFDVDPSADPPYLVMERVSGPSLKEQLDGKPMGITEVRSLGIQIANALAAAHAVGIVHRDVKPANILVAGPGAWKLADFGVAHVPNSSLTMTGQFVGSPAYAPPEALLKGQSTSAGDVYGLGATLYQAITGSWPRLDATSSALIAPVPKLREVLPNVPPEIADAIDRACALEPVDRPTAPQLANILATRTAASTALRLSASGAVAHAPTELPLHVVPAVASKRRAYAIAAAALVAIVVVAIVATRGKPTAAPGVAPVVPVADPPRRDDDDDDHEPGPPEHGDPQKEFAKAYSKYIEGKYDDARHRLDDWQRRYDPQHLDPNANDLRALLDEAGPEKRKGPKGPKH